MRKFNQTPPGYHLIFLQLAVSTEKLEAQAQGMRR